MLYGILIGGSVAFIVLLFASYNIIITVYATFSIVGIINGVLAVSKMNDWSLGIVESVASTIVIGFSVDYVIHLVLYLKKLLFSILSL